MIKVSELCLCVSKYLDKHVNIQVRVLFSPIPVGSRRTLPTHPTKIGSEYIQNTSN